MDVEEALDTLYRTAPEDFVGIRNGLVRGLKAAGAAEAAALVQKLRRPTAAIWAVNQLTHADAQGIVGLLDATQRLAAAQAGGDAAAFRTAGRDRRDVLHGLATRAASLLHEVGVRADKVEEVSAILDAASMQPDLADTLLKGRLAEPPERPTGFELGFEMEPTEADSRPADEQHRRQAERSSAEHAVRRARERLEQLTDAVVAAQQAVERLEDELARARERAGEITEEAEAARADLVAAEEVLNRTF